MAEKPRRWPVASLVGFITAVAGVCAVVPVADWGMEMHHVSNMEGGRGCAMIGLWMPLAAVLGFACGFVVSVMTAGAGFVGYLKRQGIALAVAAVLLGLGAALTYSTADHPPLIDGKALALEIEVQAPAKGRTVEQLQAADFTVGLLVSASDRRYADLRWVDAVESNESIFVTAWATLNSRNAGREITVGTKDESRQIFSVMLPASPKKTTDEWSDWSPPRQRFDGSKPAPEDQYLVRYRVRFAQEYSPTPSPTLPPSESSPAPSEEETTPPESPPENT